MPTDALTQAAESLAPSRPSTNFFAGSPVGVNAEIEFTFM